MDKLDEIKKPLKGDFEEYRNFMSRALVSESGYVSDVMDYIVSSSGKGVRPMLVFLMAGIHSKYDVVSKRAYLAAMLVEMIHTASLVHDDVVDESLLRHGKPTVNSRWNSRVSVLSGDYILARSFRAGMESGQFDLVSYIVSGVSDLAEGELMQNEVNEHRGVTRDAYLNIIFKKTATLLGISCGAGAMAAGASLTEVGIARQVGINLGMAFQIKDDILDFAPEAQTGKPFCDDLREGKVTLPLLTVLERNDDLARRLIMGKVASCADDPAAIDEVHELVVKEGGLAAAGKVVDEYLDSARGIIATYTDSEFRDSLLSLCDYIGARER